MTLRDVYNYVIKAVATKLKSDNPAICNVNSSTDADLGNSNHNSSSRKMKIQSPSPCPPPLPQLPVPPIPPITPLLLPLPENDATLQKHANVKMRLNIN